MESLVYSVQKMSNEKNKNTILIYSEKEKTIFHQTLCECMSFKVWLSVIVLIQSMVTLLNKSKLKSKYYKRVQRLHKTPYWAHLCGVGSTAELHHRAQCPGRANSLESRGSSDHRISKVHLWSSFLSSNVLRITWFLSY